MRYVCALLLFTASVIGCSNIIDTKMMSSKSIFLTPGATKTIYLQTCNISENQGVQLNDLAGKLSAKGYQVLQDPSHANLLLQTKIVYCNQEKEPVSFQSVLAGGFSVGIGSTSPGFSSGTTEGTPDMNAMMAQMQMQSMAMMRGMGGMQQPKQDESVLYFCAVDVQVTEQGKGNVAPAMANPSGPPPPGQPNQMRVVAGVRQKKLDLEEATPLIREKLTAGLAGMF